MSIDLKTVDKLATLSRLSFDETEKQKIADELTKILEFVSQLQEVNTDGVEPMTSTVGSDVTPERDDETLIEHSREALLSNAPASEMGFYVVPRVVE
ncbi:MAG: Asp-tRNA(Asn)/Glu-tRNA(Gln) amidotransferase subunit GatC [Pseudomonadota bacterium]|nr:Asp-tRNA(Asn)/Glu-tRNA(Gln) amidotransferase subunit GatC [Pseudomonadota bacterium]